MQYYQKNNNTLPNEIIVQTKVFSKNKKTKNLNKRNFN